MGVQLNKKYSQPQALWSMGGGLTPIVRIIVVAIVYLVAGWGCTIFTKLGSAPSPMWFPSGVGLTALLLWGQIVWLGIFVGDWLLNLILGETWEFGLASAVGSSLTAIIAWRCLRYCRFSPSLTSLKDVFSLVFLAALLATTLNATLEATLQAFNDVLCWSNFRRYWSMVWLGDSTAVMVITPFLLRLGGNWRALWRRSSKHHWVEASVCLGLLVGVGWIVFAARRGAIDALIDHFSTTQYLEYLPFPFVVWAAIRFPSWGAVTANLLVALLAIAGAIQGIGTFVLQTPDREQAILLLQVFLAIVTTTSLFLAAAISERQQFEQQLRDTLEREQLLTQVALQVHQSLDLEYIFNTTVNEIRSLLDAEQVYLACLGDGERVKIVAESMTNDIPALRDWTGQKQFLEDLKTLFSYHNSLILNNTISDEIPLSLQNYYDYFKIKAALVLPLWINEQHLGVLVVHQYSRTRHWLKNEVQLLEQLATQVSLAIYQARLYQQVQKLNSNLEGQVAERTLQLQGKIEETQQLYDMKTVFVQAVYHDLRTSIIGLAMLLKNLQNRIGDEIALSRSNLERMIKGSDRQLTLIKALAEDHLEEHPSLILHCQRTSITEIVNRLIADWYSIFEQNKITLINLVTQDLPNVYIDPLQIRQVFEHLFSNALKHNPPGIKITLNAKVEINMIRCAVIDNGVGMDQGQCKQLFKLYVRNLHNHRLTGIGLGTYQCRQIIEAHGGKIGVSSTPNIGSEFWFTLPLS